MTIKVVPGGSGQAEDAALVAAQLAQLPKAVGDALASHGIKVVACRDNVVDYAPRLKNDHPRNWPDGQTWKDVPGAYLPTEKAVAIATIQPAGEARRVPRDGEKHGSRSLAVHETMHGYDYAFNRSRSRDSGFRSVWSKECKAGAITDAYFTDATAGPEETYAESAAMHFGVDPTDRARWPLFVPFWNGFGGAPVGTGATLRMMLTGLAAGLRPKSRAIGSGHVAADGTVVLDLTAESAAGDIGHAQLRYAPTHPHHAAMLAHLRAHPAAHRAGVAGIAAGSASFLVQPFR